MAASGGLLTNKTVVLAKIEATYGTDSAPAVSANEVEVFGLSIKVQKEKVERKPLRASLSPLPSSKTKLLYDISFETELKNGGTAGTIGRLSPLFQSCGMKETISAGVSVTYKPDAPDKSCTIWVYKDGVVFKAKGCRGSFEIVADSGKIPMVKWTFKGIYTVPADLALCTPVYETTIGQICENVACAVSGFVGYTRNYSINLNNQIVDRASINAAVAAGGMVGVLIGSRNPTGKILLEAELTATEPMWTEFDADTLVDFTATHGASAGNIVTITGTGKTQYDAIDPTDENGVFMYSCDLQFSGTSDETSIVMT